MNLCYSNNLELDNKFVRLQDSQGYFHQAQDNFFYYSGKMRKLSFHENLKNPELSELWQKYYDQMEEYRSEIISLANELSEKQNLEQLKCELTRDYVIRMKDQFSK